MTKYDEIMQFNIDDMAGFIAKVTINAMEDPIEKPFDEIKEAFLKALKTDLDDYK